MTRISSQTAIMRQATQLKILQPILGMEPVSNDCTLHDLQQAFPERCEPTLGAELEWGIVNRTTNQPQKRFDELSHELSPRWQSQVHSEFLGCQIEFASRSHATVSQLSRELSSFCSSATLAARRWEAELSWKANFPNWHFQRTMVTDTPRSLLNLARLGPNAQHLSTNSLHLHVAVPRSKAISIIDGLQGFIPLFVALSANSPIQLGSPTGVKSHRVSLWANQFAACGLSSPYGSWRNFEQRMRALVQSQRIATAKDLYYFVRPTRYGTLELRCCDLPANVNQAIALAALYQTLVVAISEGAISFRREMDLTRAELHQAYTHGIQATLTSHTGQLVSPLEWLERLHYELEPIALSLKADATLKFACEVLQENGAEQQLRDYASTDRSPPVGIARMANSGRYQRLAISSIVSAASLMGAMMYWKF